MSFLLERFWLLLNSSFFTTIVAAFAGASGGAFIVERIKNRQSILAEIRNTNAAIMIVFGIANSYLGIKNKFVRPIFEKYFDARKEVWEKMEAKKSNNDQGNNVIEYHGDFQALEPIPNIAGSLEQLIFEKIGLNGRPLSATSGLFMSMSSLNTMLKKRNLLISEYRSELPIDPQKFVYTYFGFPDQNGNIDETFKSVTEGIYKHTDDCIFFSMALIEDLVEHGLALKKRYGRKAPKVNSPKFDSERTKLLTPKSSDYEEWTNAFRDSKSDKKEDGETSS